MSVRDWVMVEQEGDGLTEGMRILKDAKNRHSSKPLFTSLKSVLSMKTVEAKGTWWKPLVSSAGKFGTWMSKGYSGR